MATRATENIILRRHQDARGSCNKMYGEEGRMSKSDGIVVLVSLLCDKGNSNFPYFFNSSCTLFVGIENVRIHPRRYKE
jgi:hypothetical protein